MDLIKKHCVPCEGGTPPLSDEDEQYYSMQVPAWLLLRNGNHRIRRQFTFTNFKQAIEFVNKVADIAEAERHHPDILIVYNKVQVDLFTHAVGGLSENDFIVATKIDAIPQ